MSRHSVLDLVFAKYVTSQWDYFCNLHALKRQIQICDAQNTSLSLEKGYLTDKELLNSI